MSLNFDQKYRTGPMKRLIDYELEQWKIRSKHKPLLLRGARQIGKTHAVRALGKTFEDYLEINLEDNPKARDIFEKDLFPERIAREIAVLFERPPIIPGKTLLFFDEIQAAPKALLALRYFYEQMPDLHVIAAGSLLDFAIQSVGIPVGRVLSLYMYPMTFIEFLWALNNELLVEEIVKHSKGSMSEPIHQKALELLGSYLAVGGMPEAVSCWKETKNILECALVHHAIIDTYRQDFAKYAKDLQIKYVELLFDAVPRQLSERFKYSAIDGDYRKRELAPCLDLLETAGIVRRVYHTGAHGAPLGAEVDPHHFKTIFVDIALAQTILGSKLGGWLLDPLKEFVNKGPIVESFVGQELLGYSYPHMRSRLFYWERAARGSEAEVDYVFQENEHIIPIEVKSGRGTALFSMHSFLNTHENSPYGVRFSPRNYAIHQKIKSIPLYAIAGTFASFSERIGKTLSLE